MVIFVVYLDYTIRTQFEGKRWALPARVYARPLELYPGMKLSAEQLTAELTALGYHKDAGNEEPGTFRRNQNELEIFSRPFRFWDKAQASQRLRVEFNDAQVAALNDVEIHIALNLARLDPLLIGSIYPTHNEDRVLVRLNEVPLDLVRALVTVEDRKFYSHHGIDPRGMARALLANLRIGNGTQGGSTLTQQLVKNFYLTAERTLRRKLVEIIMAMLLELHYQKDEILEAYVNEIYLGQEGGRGIHGFGLAGEFYFGRPLNQLQLPQIALLVGLVKGPSHYDPRRHPERALARRNLVLTELARKDFINQEQMVAAKAAPLGVTAKAPSGTSPYPAFLDLVHRQLRRDYHEQDLRSEGLQIFTTLDPHTQRVAERSLATRLSLLEKQRRIPAATLEGAIVVTSIENGEVLALVGGRNARFEGFNRALDAERQIGSLIKPVVYLTALERPASYTLATLLNDDPLTLREHGTKDWTPNNYDKKSHGEVMLQTALANSYNLSTARLGLAIGVPQIIENIHRLGVERELPPYPSTLLGSSNLTPLEVAQMYQTLASGGFRMPLRAIREILTANSEPLQRYPLAVEQTIEPAPSYLLTTALQTVVREGTAQALNQYLSPDLHIAGKTGTTDDLRDSWFAGYTGDRLAVVWTGRDDNRSAGLTGASGAMTVWGDMMSQLDPEPLLPAQPENIEYVWIDPATRLRADKDCKGAVELPFIRDSAPNETSPCVSRSPIKAIKGWFRRLFE
jgi:penicillin-binding protein 1B